MKKIAGEELRNLATQLTNSQNKPQEAALIANEISDRVGDRSIKAAYETTAVVKAAEFLNVKDPITYDPAQRRVVPTENFDKTVREFQSKEGLKVNGNLNNHTLEKAAGTTVAQILSTNRS